MWACAVSCQLLAERLACVLAATHIRSRLGSGHLIAVVGPSVFLLTAAACYGTAWLSLMLPGHIVSVHGY